MNHKSLSAARWKKVMIQDLTPVVLLAACALQAAVPRAAAYEELLPDPHEMARVEASVDRALEYLLKSQQPNGTWPSSKGSNNAIDALCQLVIDLKVQFEIACSAQLVGEELVDYSINAGDNYTVSDRNAAELLSGQRNLIDPLP